MAILEAQAGWILRLAADLRHTVTRRRPPLPQAAPDAVHAITGGIGDAFPRAQPWQVGVGLGGRARHPLAGEQPASDRQSRWRRDPEGLAKCTNGHCLRS